jgi:hypothetical protein
MNGRLTDAWPYSWDAIWAPLENTKGVPADLFIELYAELEATLVIPIDSIERGRLEGIRASIANDVDSARQAFIDLEPSEFRGDPELARFYENIFVLLSEYGDSSLTCQYRAYLDRYLKDLNLRYELTDNNILVPHISGIVAALRMEVEKYSKSDPKLEMLLSELDNSIANLSRLPNQANAKAWITRSSVYTEGLAQAVCNSKQSLGKLCKNGKLFPHKALEEAVSQLYGFCSDYVGLRHAGTMKSHLRNVDIQDAVSIAIILHGLSSYLIPTADFAEIMGVQGDKLQ